MARERRRYLDPAEGEILRLEEREQEEDDFTEDESRRLDELRDARGRARFDAFPKLTYCDVARGFHAVAFFADMTYEAPPEGGRWRMREHDSLGEERRMRDPDWHKKEVPGARFCPFCGALTPEMRLRAKPPPDLCVVTDGGYYCDTCGERLRSCRCLPPEAAFEEVFRGPS
jgi:hypothetical protein